jgi:hypothetical protein
MSCPGPGDDCLQRSDEAPTASKSRPRSRPSARSWSLSQRGSGAPDPAAMSASAAIVMKKPFICFESAAILVA